MYRFLLIVAAYVSSFWLIGNLAIKLFGFAPEWSWLYTLSPLCLTIPVGILVRRLQHYDATRAQRDFMKRFEAREHQGIDRVKRHKERQGNGVQIHDITHLEEFDRWATSLIVSKRNLTP